MEIVEGQADPRRAQDGQPGDAVAEMRERPRERIEVLHHLLLPQVLDLDGAEADAGGLQRGHDVGERIALAHQDRGAVLRLSHQLHHAARLGFAVGQRMPGGGFAAGGFLVGMGGGRRIRHRPRGRVGFLRQDPRKGSVEECDQVLLRAEVRGKRDRLELHAAEPLVARLEEERDLRLAEAVDRLHRVETNSVLARRAFISLFQPLVSSVSSSHCEIGCRLSTGMCFTR